MLKKTMKEIELNDILIYNYFNSKKQIDIRYELDIENFYQHFFYIYKLMEEEISKNIISNLNNFYFL